MVVRLWFADRSFGLTRKLYRYSVHTEYMHLTSSSLCSPLGLNSSREKKCQREALGMVGIEHHSEGCGSAARDCAACGGPHQHKPCCFCCKCAVLCLYLTPRRSSEGDCSVYAWIIRTRKKKRRRSLEFSSLFRSAPSKYPDVPGSFPSPAPRKGGRDKTSFSRKKKKSLKNSVATRSETGDSRFHIGRVDFGNWSPSRSEICCVHLRNQTGTDGKQFPRAHADMPSGSQSRWYSVRRITSTYIEDHPR